MKADVIENRLRRFLLLLAAFALITTVIELWLENHTQEPAQFIPWVLCGLGLLALVAALARPSRATLLALRGAMGVVALGGLLGIAIHLSNNLAFEQEIHPRAALGDALLVALKGAAPLLAPGALTFAALLALAATYYHPALENRNPS